MTDHAHELRRYARKIGRPAGDVPAVMLAAADEIERLRTESAGLIDDMNLLRDNNTALRARIEYMEQQEPAGKFIQHPSHGMWEQDGYSDNPDAKPLYLAPGAQPAPSVPYAAIGTILTEVMDLAVKNGADSRSMPDEYVAVAAWLCGIKPKSAPEEAKCPDQ